MMHLTKITLHISFCRQTPGGKMIYQAKGGKQERKSGIQHTGENKAFPKGMAQKTLQRGLSSRSGQQAVQT